VTVGDFNDDAALDFDASNRGTSDVSVVLGNGRGGIAASLAFTTGDAPSALNAAAIDGDGHTDLAVADRPAPTTLPPCQGES